jgi:hypothetical protein
MVAIFYIYFYTLYSLITLCRSAKPILLLSPQFWPHLDPNHAIARGFISGKHPRADLLSFVFLVGNTTWVFRKSTGFLVVAAIQILYYRSLTEMFKLRNFCTRTKTISSAGFDNGCGAGKCNSIRFNF